MNLQESVFRNMLTDPLLQKKYNITEEEANKIKLHEFQDKKILEIIRQVVINYIPPINESNVKKIVNNSFRI